MAQLTYNIKYKKNSELVLSVKDLKDKYLFGINIDDQQGLSYDDSSYLYYIKSAQNYVEKSLNILLNRQVYEESFHFRNDDWRNWGYIQCTYPVHCPLSLEGFLNTTKQATYPPEWLSSKRTSEEQTYHRNLYVVPAGADATALSSSVVFSGVVPQIGYSGWTNIPNYWTVRYVTGFKSVPRDLTDLVGKFASISALNIAGDLVIGAGIASSSLSIDGLSQSIQTTQSAENSAYSARIRQYLSELKEQMPIIKQRYVGLTMGAA